MVKKIEQPIVGYKVITQDDKVKAEQAVEQQEKNNVVQMHESVQRPEMLLGSTYKIKTPMSDHALYVTINDIILNEGTEHEQRRPFEVFINSKNLDHFQWVVALTRVISAVFRKGGDVTFLVEELQAVFDPQGGYFKQGNFKPSLVAEIGDAIEQHMKMIGMLKDDRLDENQKALVEQKRAEYEAQNSSKKSEEGAEKFPDGAQLCGKCYKHAVVRLDGCNTCLSCGDSKCG